VQQPNAEQKAVDAQQDDESDGNVEDAEEGEPFVPLAESCREKNEVNDSSQIAKRFVFDQDENERKEHLLNYFKHAYEKTQQKLHIVT